MKTAEDFEKQAELKGITTWESHDCSMCGYVVGYEFHGKDVYYDNGCDCTNGRNLNTRTWEDVAERYNIQSNSEVIDRMNKYWGFN